MHELSIVEALIEQVQREVQRSGRIPTGGPPGRIRRLELAVGRLSGVSCDSLRFAFELLSGDTPVAGAELQITEPKATCRCQTCHARQEVDEITVRCPACGSTQVTLEGGRELLLQSIEIED
jgi:hydrogenase nickel incorporation protein HypA/HybF